MSSEKPTIPEPHPESSLTAPEDRDRALRWRPDQATRALTEPEVQEALKAHNVNAFIEKFPRVDRTYQDPPIPMQNIGLFSFVPAKGAKANENGVYGYAKLRRKYMKPIATDQRSEVFIRNGHYYHPIYQTYVGRPFPCTTSSTYSADVKEIDIRKQMTESISASVKQQKEEEKKEIDEIKNREKELLEVSNKARRGEETTNVYDEYITLQVERSQLCWTFLEHLKKLEEVRDIIIKTRKQITDLDEAHPDYAGKYYEKYMNARRQAGLDENIRDVQDNFLRFMVQDVPIPTIDTEETLPKRPDLSVMHVTTSEKKSKSDEAHAQVDTQVDTQGETKE